MSGSIMLCGLLVSWPLPASHRALRAALLLSLLLCKSLVSCCRPGEYLNEGICCPLCPPGSVVRDHCTATLSSTVCIPCVDKTYMDLSNGLLKCFRCKECDVGAGLFEKTKCTPNSNTKCECQNGYYCASGEECDLCTPHTKCRPGEYVKAEGNSSANTVCEPCPPGQFSTEFMAKICTPWKRCDYTVKEGNSTSNSECGRRQLFYVAIIPVIIAVAVIVYKEGGTFKLPTRQTTPSNEAAQTLENLRRKEVTMRLHASTLAEYVRSYRIPRGLRSPLTPNLLNTDDEFIRHWYGLSNQYSRDLMLLTIKHLQVALDKTKEEITVAEQVLRQTCPVDKLESTFTTMDENIEKLYNTILQVKMKKLERDNKDYETNQVYTWSKARRTTRRPPPYQRPTMTGPPLSDANTTESEASSNEDNPRKRNFLGLRRTIQNRESSHPLEPSTSQTETPRPHTRAWSNRGRGRPQRRRYQRYPY